MRTLADDMVDALAGYEPGASDADLIVFLCNKGFALAEIKANLETVKSRRMK